MVKYLNDNDDLVAYTLGDVKSVDQVGTIVEGVSSYYDGRCSDQYRHQVCLGSKTIWP